MYSLIPVSYTHLDVYKRQTQKCWGIFEGETGVTLPMPSCEGDDDQR